jgi:hypothetical protein
LLISISLGEGTKADFSGHLLLTISISLCRRSRRESI